MILTRESPRGNNFNIGLKPVEGEFEADLVVSFACASMGDKAGNGREN